MQSLVDAMEVEEMTSNAQFRPYSSPVSLVGSGLSNLGSSVSSSSPLQESIDLSSVSSGSSLNSNGSDRTVRGELISTLSQSSSQPAQLVNGQDQTLRRINQPVHGRQHTQHLPVRVDPVKQGLAHQSRLENLVEFAIGTIRDRR